MEKRHGKLSFVASPFVVGQRDGRVPDGHDDVRGRRTGYKAHQVLPG